MEPLASATQGMPPPQGAQPQQGAAALQQLGQAAANACGHLVQALKKIPGIDPGAVEQAGAQLRQSLMAVVQTVHTARKGGPGAPPPGAPPGMPPG